MENDPAQSSKAALPEPEVTTETDFSYFENLQQQPMTRVDIAKFLFLVGFPLVSFIVAVVLMHIYND